MRAPSLLYHDVIAPPAWDASGFPGAAAGSYKLSVHDFERHVEAIGQAVAGRAVSVLEMLTRGSPGHDLLISFDDGGASACSTIADVLEARAWRGHFFITTDYIGHPAFVSREELRELRDRGHVIGTHSCSHPLRMAAFSFRQLQREWTDSREKLSDILQEEVVVGSIPGGQYSQDVARAAADAGLRVLFTSEPRVRWWSVDGCAVVGRFTLRSRTPASTAARLARGEAAIRFSHWIRWNMRKVVKTAGGEAYLRAREALLGS
jgi:peptidoglycan/xylan/chitin deacetylase (PgdA/CDA1 family)